MATFQMTNMISSDKHTVIVTGGSRGYGAGIAEAFAAAGSRVWITGRSAGGPPRSCNGRATG